MPLYDFRCQTCGEFEVWRTIAELKTPVPCPTCQVSAKRLFSPPNVSLSSGRLRAIGRRTAEEPKLVKCDRNSQHPSGGRSGSGNGQPARSQVQNIRQGRPWMISH